MHDAKGRPLQVGDRVLVPAYVTQVSPESGFCNVSVETSYGRRPDDKPETLSAINTGVMLRANIGDENSNMFDGERDDVLQAA